MKKYIVIELILLSAFSFGLGRYYEARIRLPEVRDNIMSAYRDGKAECKNEKN